MLTILEFAFSVAAGKMVYDIVSEKLSSLETADVTYDIPDSEVFDQ